MAYSFIFKYEGRLQNLGTPPSLASLDMAVDSLRNEPLEGTKPSRCSTWMSPWISPTIKFWNLNLKILINCISKSKQN